MFEIFRKVSNPWRGLDNFSRNSLKDLTCKAKESVMTTLVTSTCDEQTRIEVGRRWFGVRARDGSRQSCQEVEVTSE